VLKSPTDVGGVKSRVDTKIHGNVLLGSGVLYILGAWQQNMLLEEESADLLIVVHRGFDEYNLFYHHYQYQKHYV
jgi:hypothetical protein